MKARTEFLINRYEFDANMLLQLNQLHFTKEFWPIVYLLSDGAIKEAYVGETTDAFARMSVHLKTDAKSNLTTVHLISSEKFNKSATLDIESNLIKYIAGDGQYKLLNGNIGLADHNYYQKKEVYWDLFISIWHKLRSEGITKHSIEYINNSDLFKYSPYKNLSFDQRRSLLSILNGLLSDTFKALIINGGAGTGKTILAIFLFKLLMTNNDDFNFKEFGDDEIEFVETVVALKIKYPKPDLALVVPMSSFRNTLKKVFKNIKGLNANMVVGPSEITNKHFDIILVDESHRLRQRINLGTYFGAFDKGCEKLGLNKNTSSELDWVLLQSDKTILFYDCNQSIKPSDVSSDKFVKLKSKGDTKVEYLKSQFRSKGGVGYSEYIDKLLTCKLEKDEPNFQSKEYEFFLFDSIENMVAAIKKKDSEASLSRLIAGYAWPWISKTDKTLFDIKIGNCQLQWNSVTNDYINSPNAINEVGCIHTTQGYDLNYTGVIFGPEITYDIESNQIKILKENYYDKNGKQSISDADELKSFILNIYKTILLRAINGTYVYVCDKPLREYLAYHINPHLSNVATIQQPNKELVLYENAVPLYDLKAAAGNFSQLQHSDNFELVAIPARYKPTPDLFACKVIGESMNKIIPNGSICLFRKYTGGSRNGKMVLVELSSLQESEFGSRYIVKEYHSIKKIDSDGWEHQLIRLKPLSNESVYKEIELEDDALQDLRVIGIFECIID